MPQLGPLEILVVLVIALLVFGPNRLPEMARQVGGALRELRRIQLNLRDDLHELMTDESEGAEPPPTLPPKAGALEAGEGSGGDGSATDAPGATPEAPDGASPETSAAESAPDVPPRQTREAD